MSPETPGAGCGSNISEMMASEIKTLMVLDSDKDNKIREISSKFGLWLTCERSRVLEEHPRIREYRGKKRVGRLLNVFCEELAEHGTKIPGRWKKDIIAQHQRTLALRPVRILPE